jgi:6-pyruvoyltetrahydropterin/6-carboxytetrahydropterin synthase
VRLGREFHIDSSHQLEGHPKCGRLHGHTYRIEVMLEGEEDERGMVMDFADFRREAEAFLDHLDHAHLNEFVEQPTVENLARYILQGLRRTVPQVVQVRVWEGLRKFAEYSEPPAG